MTDDRTSLIEAGSTVVRRNVFRGRLLSAVPCRVIEASDGLLAIARWPGVVGWWEKSWVDWLRTGDDTLRTTLIEDLAAGTWELTPWTWRATAKLELLIPEAYFSVSLFVSDNDDAAPPGWYVDFIRPFTRTGRHVDAFDLMLDLVISPDGALRDPSWALPVLPADAAG